MLPTPPSLGPSLLRPCCVRSFVVLRDQEGVPRLLPTLLQPLVPPKEVINRRDEEYMVADEAAYKPNTAWEMFQYVMAIEFAEEHQFNTSDGVTVEKEEDVVLAPPFLLDMRKGAGRGPSVWLGGGRPHC